MATMTQWLEENGTEEIEVVRSKFDSVGLTFEIVEIALGLVRQYADAYDQERADGDERAAADLMTWVLDMEWGHDALTLEGPTRQAIITWAWNSDLNVDSWWLEGEPEDLWDNLERAAYCEIIRSAEAAALELAEKYERAENN